MCRIRIRIRNWQSRILGIIGVRRLRRGRDRGAPLSLPHRPLFDQIYGTFFGPSVYNGGRSDPPNYSRGILGFSRHRKVRLSLHLRLYMLVKSLQAHLHLWAEGLLCIFQT